MVLGLTEFLGKVNYCELKNLLRGVGCLPSASHLNGYFSGTCCSGLVCIVSDSEWWLAYEDKFLNEFWVSEDWVLFQLM